MRGSARLAISRSDGDRRTGSHPDLFLAETVKSIGMAFIISSTTVKIATIVPVAPDAAGECGS